MSTFAFVGPERQICVHDIPAARARMLSVPVPRAPARQAGAWSMLALAKETWSWPTWSPDGQWLASFAVEGGDRDSGPARAVTHSVDGVRQVEWAELHGVSPIYLQWHPDGQALCILAQEREELVLALARADRIGRVRPLENGVPLFFNWSPGGSRLVIHAGKAGGSGGRLVVRDPLGTAEDVLLPGEPGSFCAPVFAGDRAVFAIRGADGNSELAHSALDGGQLERVGGKDGLVAIVAAPTGRASVAISVAPGGEGTPYQGIEILDLPTGEIRKVVEGPCFAFYFAPAGDALVYAVVAAQENCLGWWRVPVEGGTPEFLGSFWPTRDVLFYLHFFDQYAQSHPPISPDGKYLVFAGYPAGGGQADLSEAPRVFVKDLGSGAPPTAVAQGTFAVFPPARR